MLKVYISLNFRYSGTMRTVEHKVTSPQLDAYNRYINYGLSHDQAMTAVGTKQLTPPPSPVQAPIDQPFEITKNQLNLLLLEAHKKSANATEEVAAIRELGKINGLYERTEPDITINIQQNVHKLEVLSDAELLKLAGRDEELLTNEPIEAEYEEVEVNAEGIIDG